MDKITLTNIGTYHEIEYLKKTLGPVLISALAEVCMKRPTDPIEYLGHWLLRWRYNEELKRRDMENSIQVIRQRQAAKCEQEMNIGECPLPLDPYGQGVVPLFPFLPPGYGGPLSEEDLAGLQPEVPAIEEEEEEVESRMGEMPGEGYDPGFGNNNYELLGEGGYYDAYPPQYGYDGQGQVQDEMGAYIDPNNPSEWPADAVENTQNVDYEEEDQVQT